MELNKAVLDCMQALRRRLRDELTLDIRLSQADAVEAMLLACLRSTDQDTRNLGIRLAELSDFHGAAPRRAEASAAPLPPSVGEEPIRGASVRMYRGQRVYA
ncbi:hypothetical protein AAFN46_02795 [Pseudomonas sp. CAU 1711]|uniref:hypothetical protein n=1 Tax=Pseudomonas sp. CAU 1711 TaxID=3140356 RepID=UPI00325FFF2D